MTSFDNRLALGCEFEQEVEAYLRSDKNVLSVAKNGTEHTHPDFVNLIRGNDAQSAKFIRFAPDGVFLKDENVYHYEAKSTHNIEKDAYLTYMSYVQMGCNIILFARFPSRNVFWAPITEVLLQTPSCKWPIDEDGWACPRNAAPADYAKCYGSGTPYKTIDEKSMHRILSSEWKAAINQTERATP